MAFDIYNWARVSAGTYDNSVVTYSYQTSDSLSTVKGSGYFNDAPEVGGNDIIIVMADSVAQVLKTSLSGSTITTSVVSQTEDSSIDSQHYVDGSIDSEHLSSGLAPLYSALYTTTGGGLIETITVSGLQTTDVVIADMNTKGASPVSCTERRVSAADTLYLKFSADPSTDHILNIIVYRPLN